MKRSRFSEEQIIGILREQEAGAPSPHRAARFNISNIFPYPRRGCRIFRAFILSVAKNGEAKDYMDSRV